MKRLEIVAELRAAEADDEYFHLEGVANTPSIDTYDTIIEPQGAEVSLPIPLFMSHDRTQPVGEVVSAKITPEKVTFSARIPKQTTSEKIRERITEATESIRLNLMRGVSVGFDPISDVIRKGRIVYTKWRWKELSLVAMPANSDAKVTAFRADDGTKTGGNMDLEEQLAALEEERNAIRAEMDSYGNPATLEKDDAKKFDELSERFDEVSEKHRRVEKAITARDSARPVQDRTQDYTNHVEKPAARREASREMRVEVSNRNDPKGITFVRAVRAQLMATETNTPINTVIRELYGFGDVANEVRASVNPGTTISGNWGANLFQPNAAAAEFLEYLAPHTLVGKFGANGVPALGRGRFFVPMVSQTSVGGAYWVGQGLAKPATAPAFADQSILRFKIAAIIGATDELLELANATDGESQLMTSLRTAATEMLDTTFLDATNTTVNVRPAGLRYNLSATSGSGGSDGTSVASDVATLRKTLNALHYPASGTVLIINSSRVIDLIAMRSPLTENPLFPTLTESGGRLEGLPVVVTDYLDYDKVVIMHAPSVYVADGGISTGISPHATVLLDNDASTLVSGTPAFSAWQRDAQVLRVVRPMGWTKRVGAVQWMENVAWGSGDTT